MSAAAINPLKRKELKELKTLKACIEALDYIDEVEEIYLDKHPLKNGEISFQNYRHDS